MDALQFQTDSNGRRRLDAWKRIAAYLHRSERTVRRWEAEEKLPVHRLKHGQSSTVYAYADELESWLSTRSRSPVDLPAQETVDLLILPIEDLTAGGTHAHVCEGIREELILGLSKCAETRARVRPHVPALAEQPNGKVRAGFAIRGSVRVQAGEMKIVLHLVRMEDDGIIESLEAQLDDGDQIGAEEAVAAQAIDRFASALSSP